MIQSTLCYIERDNKTLMMHRVKKENDMHEGKYNGVGGKLEAGETPQECAIREIYEETGLSVKDPDFKGMITFPKLGKKQEDWVVYIFRVINFSGELIDCNEGNLEWIETDKLMDLNLWEGDRIFIPWLQKDAFFSGKFEYGSDETLSAWSVDFY